MPTGGNFTNGAGAIALTPGALTINQTTQRGIINFSSFSVGAGNLVSINNTPGGATLARVLSGPLSVIDGRVVATGSFYLVNPAGVVIDAGGSVVTGGSFAASTLNIADTSFMAGGGLSFSGAGTGAIINLGHIASANGDILLIGNSVTNGGSLTAPNGAVVLGAGSDVLLAESGDLRAFVRGSGGDVTNSGTIAGINAELVAASGNIYALAGNNGGVIRATGVKEAGGRVYLAAPNGKIMASGTLDASGHGASGAGGEIDLSANEIALRDGFFANANGSGSGAGGTILVGGDVHGGANPTQDLGTVPMTQAQTVLIEAGASVHADGGNAGGKGGNVVAWSTEGTRVAGSISVTAGSGSAPGGFVETSSHGLLDVVGSVTTGHGGEWLLDPSDVTIVAGSGTDSNDSTAGGIWTPSAGASSSTIYVANINTALTGGTSVVINTASSGAGLGNITLTAGANIATANAAGLTLNADNNIVINGNISLGTGTLALNAPNGNVSGTGNISSGGAMQFNPGVGSGTLSGVISGGGGLTMGGAGTLVLTGANTYTGTTTISAGTLQVANGGLSGSLGTGAVVDNAALVFDPTAGFNPTIANVISGTGSLTKLGAGEIFLTANDTYSGATISGGGTLFIGNGASGSISASSATSIISGATLALNLATGSTFSNDITGHGDLAFLQSGALTVSGSLLFSGNLAQNGSGTTTLTGANTYTGVTTVNGGALQIGNGGATGTLGTGSVSIAAAKTLIFDRSDSITVANAISGAGALTMAGPGTLVLSGADTYAGATTISAGTLAFTASEANTAGVTIAAGATLALSNNAAVSNPTSGLTTISGTVTGNGTLYGYNASGGALAAVTFSGSPTLTATGGSLTIVGTAVNQNTRSLQLNAGANVTTNGSVTLDGVASGTPNSRRALILAGNAELNAATGTLTVTLSDINNDVTYAPFGHTLTAGGTQNWSISGSYSDTWTAGTGAFNLTTLPGAALNLSGTGSYASNMSGWTWNLGAGSTVSINSVYLNGTLNLAGSGTLTSTLPLTDNSTIAIATATDDPVISGVVSGGYGLTKSGAGTLTLTGTNTYTGTTTVSAGTLDILNTSTNSVIGALGTGAVSVGSGAILEFTNSDNINDSYNVTNVISGAGSVTLNGPDGAITELSAANTYSGGTTISSGIVNVFNNSALGVGTVTMTGGALRATAGPKTLSNNFILSGTIGWGLLTNLTGTVTLSGNTVLTASENSGGSTWSGGVVTAGYTLATGDSGPNVSGGSWSGQLLLISGAISGSGGVTQNSLGTLVLSGSNTYTGATTVSEGTLQAGSTTAFGSNSATTVASGATLNLAGYSNSVGSLSGAGTVTDSTASAVTLTTGGANTSTTFAGTIQNGSGTVALTQNGTGTLTLSGANTYTGTTTVSAGTLTLSGSLNVGAGTENAAVASGALFNGGGVLTASTLSVSGAGTVDLPGSNAVGTVVGSGTIGTLTLNDAQSLSAGAITANGPVLLSTTGTSSNITLTNSGGLSSAATGSAVTLQAGGSITANEAITASSSGGNVILDSNAAGGTTGGVKINATAGITTNGGNITIGGGAAPATTAANSSGTTGAEGVLVDGPINAGGGNIVINGTGHTNGVWIGAAVQTSGAGSITITGVAGSGTGIDLNNAGITAANGSISLTGTGGGSGLGVNADAASGGVSDGSGSITIIGTAGATGSSGIGFYAGTPISATAGGQITLIGILGASPPASLYSQAGPTAAIAFDGPVGGAHAGAITLIGDSIFFDDALTSAVSVTIEPRTAGLPIVLQPWSLSFAWSPSELDLFTRNIATVPSSGGGLSGTTNASQPSDISYVTAPILRIGSTSAGAITINQSTALSATGVPTLDLISGAGIADSAGASLTVSNLALQASGTVDLSQAANSVGTLAASTNGNQLDFVNSGNLTVGIADGVSGLNSLGGASTVASASGNVIVADAITTSSATSLTLQSAGTIAVNAPITASGTATNLVLDSNSTGGTSGGVRTNATAAIMTNGGDITIGGGAAPTTTAANASGLVGSYGVVLAGTLNAGGGTIVINGTGSVDGIYVGAAIQTNGAGNIVINGTGNQYGIYVGAAIQTNGAGTISATGTAFTDAGIALDGRITTANGSITLLGNGGSAAGLLGVGIYGGGGGGLFTTGSGSIFATGNGGAAAIQGLAMHYGEQISVGAGGSIWLSGTIQSGASGYSLTTPYYLRPAGVYSDGTIGTTSGGAVTITADSITLLGAVQSGVSVTYQPLTAGLPIFVNTPSTQPWSTNELDIIAADLGSLTTPILRIGSTSAGAMTIAQSLSIAGSSVSTLDLISGAGISANTGASLSVSNLALQSDGAVTLSSTANTIGTLAASTGGNSLSFLNSGAMTIGTVDGVVGLTNLGGNSVVGTSTGNLVIAKSVSAAGTLSLISAETVAAGTASGGDISITGAATITATGGGEVNLYTGSVAGSSGVSGSLSSGAYRYDSTYTTTNFTTALTAGVNAIYREHPTATASIETGGSTSKTYDGTTLTPTITFTGLDNNDSGGSGGTISGGILRNAGSYTLSSTNAGATLAGLGYAVIQPTSVGYTINPALLVVTAQATTKTYDGTTTASGAPTISGAIYGSDSIATQASENFANRNAGTGKTIDASGMVLNDGNGGNNYRINYVPSASGTINPALLTVSALGVTKTYDGTLSAAGAPTVTGSLYGTDSVAVTASMFFANRNAGTGKTVTASGMVINDGNGGNNYTISYVPSASGTINPALLTVTALGVTKTYDGTASAAGTPTVTGTLYGTDSVAVTASMFFANRNAGSGKTVTASGMVVNDGNGGNNYTVNYVPSAAGTINPAPLSVTALGVTKTYDGTVSAAGAPTVTGTLYGTDSIAVTASMFFANRNAGSGKTVTASGMVVNDGNGGNNYTVDYVPSSAGSITPATLTVSAVGVTKTYDGTTTAAGSAVVTGTLYGGDSVAAQASLFFADRNAGTGKTVNASGLVINDGNGGGNYDVTYVPTATGVILPRTLTVSAQSTSRGYDTPNPTFVLSNYSSQLASGDTLSTVTVNGVLLTTVAGLLSAPGQYDIFASGGALGGPSGANYVLATATNIGGLTISGSAFSPLTNAIALPLFDPTLAVSLSGVWSKSALADNETTETQVYYRQTDATVNVRISARGGDIPIWSRATSFDGLTDQPDGSSK